MAELVDARGLKPRPSKGIGSIPIMSRGDDWVVKVVGCKPIGSPVVGSNPAHLIKVFLFYYKIIFLKKNNILKNINKK